MKFCEKLWSWHVENNHKIIVGYTLNKFHYSYHNIIEDDEKLNIISKFF
jgi:hypothetical protein